MENAYKMLARQSLGTRGKAVPQHIYGGAGGLYSSYSFTTSALYGVSGQGYAPDAFYPQGKDPRYPLYRRLGGPQSRSGHRAYRKNLLPLLWIEPRSPGRPARSQTLYCLSYPAGNREYLSLNERIILKCISRCGLDTSGSG
jgi:hypothetical protein